MCGYILSTSGISRCLILTGVWLSCWDGEVTTSTDPLSTLSSAPSWLMLFRRASAMQKRELLAEDSWEAGVLFGIETQAPSLTSNLPSRTNDSSTKGFPPCAFWFLRALVLLGITQVTKNITGALSVDIPKRNDQDTRAAKSSKPPTVQEFITRSKQNSSCYVATRRWTCQERTLKMLPPFSAGFWTMHNNRNIHRT